VKYTCIVTGLAAMLAIGALAAVPKAAGPTATGDPEKGQKVYAAQKCSICHKINAIGGKLGPDLDGVGTKRDAAWLAKYLVNPKTTDPKNKMPAVKVKGPDLDDLVAYLLTLKGK
jgi:mono/diheme cytochrome c family protein